MDQTTSKDPSVGENGAPSSVAPTPMASSATASAGTASGTAKSGPQLSRKGLWFGLSSVVVAAGVASFVFADRSVIIPDAHSSAPQVKKASRSADGRFWPTQSQWAGLTVDAVNSTTFSTVVATDGRIAIDEDNTTPIFSPYAGRVLSLRVKAGDRIEVGQPLFSIAATDMVQAQNDVVSSVAAVNKTASALRLAEINLTRARNLFEVKAGSQREFQAAEDARNAAVADKSAAEAALEAARNRLRLLGKTDAEIETFQKEGRISPETVIPSPISGTVVQRKVGPGQFVGGAQSDPVFVIGDLSSVWVVANVKETDAPAMKLGAPIEFRVMALPDRTFTANISYIAASVDPNTRRLTVRANVPNAEGTLKPEMFAMVELTTRKAHDAPSVPRSAIVYDGENAHVWLVGEDQSVIKRRVKVGSATGDRVQVLEGISTGDRVVARGTLFLDRTADSSQ